MLSCNRLASEPPLTARFLSLGAQYFFACLIFAIGFFGYLMNTSGWFTMIPGDLGDARFNSVILEHLYQWVTGTAPKLWSPRFFYPFENTLAFSDNHFASGFAYIVLRASGLAREEAYLGWFLIGASLNYWVCLFVLKRLGFSLVGAAAGAFVFAFGLAALPKDGHAQLVYRFAIPLGAAAWYWAIVQRSASHAAQAVFWCVVQFLCSIYLGLFLAYLLAAMLLAQFIFGARQLFATSRSRRSSRSWLKQSMAQFRSWCSTTLDDALTARGMIWGGLTAMALVLMVLTLKRYHHVAGEYNFLKTLSELISMLPRPGSYLLADHSPSAVWLGSLVTEMPMRHEQQMFVGFGVLVISLLGAVWSWRLVSVQLAAFIRVMILALVLLVGLTLFVNESSLYLYLAKLPGVVAIRAVSRIALVMLLPMAVATAAGFDALLGCSLPKRSKFFFVLLLVAALTLETSAYKSHHTPLQSWRDRRDSLQTKIGSLPHDTILFVTQPKGEPFFLTEIDAMIYAQDHQIATLNGYSGNTPPYYTYPDPCLSPEMRLDSYFAFRGSTVAMRQHFLTKLHTVFLEPCVTSINAK